VNSKAVYQEKPGKNPNEFSINFPVLATLPTVGLLKKFKTMINLQQGGEA